MEFLISRGYVFLTIRGIRVAMDSCQAMKCEDFGCERQSSILLMYLDPGGANAGCACTTVLTDK
jgi:hypothetical protein